MIKTAKISEDNKYRYALTREWDKGKGKTLWIMLNPSTADDKVDDPTIRRCIGFSRQWGRKGIIVLNLFAYRATDPRELEIAGDPIGPENDDMLEEIARDPEIKEVIVAWGTKGQMHNRDVYVHQMLCYLKKTVQCLGVTKDGHPRHPLYLPKTASPRLWSPTIQW